MFSTNNKQLYNDININNPQDIVKNTEIISNNRLISLINRNRGKLEINPIDDM
jgi:tRNA(Ser,Leu) C12 N-acetylase TAN1